MLIEVQLAVFDCELVAAIAVATLIVMFPFVLTVNSY